MAPEHRTRHGRRDHRAVLMATVTSVHIVPGPVNPVSVKSEPVEPVEGVRVPAGVPVAITLENFPQGEGMNPHVDFPGLGEV